MSKTIDPTLLKQIKQLVAVDSTADNLPALRTVYETMVGILLDSGKEITVEHFVSNGRPSLLAYKGPHRPDNFRIILNGHLDIVAADANQLKATVKDGKLYGRGVYDMKAACVLMAEAFCAYVDKVPYALGLQIVTDEEIGGFDGTQYQIEQGVRGDFVICGECGRASNKYEITNEAKGVVSVKVTFRGSTSHGAYPWRGDNAVMKATRFAQALHDRFPSPESETDATTMTVTSIATPNQTFNKVPDEAVVTIDGRYTAKDPNFRSRRHVAALIEEIDPTGSVAIPIFASPLYTSPQNPLLLSLKAAAEKVENAEFAFVCRHASSDGRHYGDVGDQACEFGIAGEHQHEAGEYVSLEALENYRSTLRTFLTTTIASEKEHVHTAAFNG